jgi:predicted nucleic acid-binding Zn ribbon protein
MTKASTRELNGYRLLYDPAHPAAMTNSNWVGYVYEHIVVAMAALGRPLRDNEVVHHLDMCRNNNEKENLLVLERGQHAKLHAWLDAGAPGLQIPGAHGVNSGKATAVELRLCPTCGRTLPRASRRFCSKRCGAGAGRKVVRPSKEDLAALMVTTSWLALGRLYGVSDNAVRKWARSYRLLPPILSQAASTEAEGAQTTGEVQPS